MPGLEPGIHVVMRVGRADCRPEGVDGRAKPGHDARGGIA